MNDRGLALHALEKYQEAIESFDQAIAINPNYTDAINNRNNTLLELESLK